MKIDRYQAYKDSEVEWLGDVPEHWNCELIKRSLQVLTDYTANGSFASLAENVTYQESGYARLVRLTDLRHDLTNDGLYVDKNAYNFLSKTKINGGEILIANVGAYTGLVKLVPKINFKATLGPNMFLAVFNNKLFKRFITYHLGSIGCFEQFRVQMTATAQPKLNKDNFRSISIVIPPLSEQKAIAHYLDTKTAQIDRKIDLLTQKATQYGNLKQSLINETVTRGLDTSVPMKDSGIEWLGEVPEHWQKGRIKDFIESNTSVRMPAYLSDMDLVEFVPMTNVDEELGKIREFNLVPLKDVSSGYTKFKNGDVIFAKITPCMENGNAALVNNLQHNIGFGSTEFIVFRPLKNLLPKYLHNFLHNFLFRKNAEPFMKGTAGQKRITSLYMAIHYLGLPPLSEQKAIAHYLDTKTGQIDQIIQTLNTQIKTLKELRKTLINDVVTGKIKVV